MTGGPLERYMHLINRPQRIMNDKEHRQLRQVLLWVRARWKYSDDLARNAPMPTWEPVTLIL